MISCLSFCGNRSQIVLIFTSERAYKSCTNLYATSMSLIRTSFTASHPSYDSLSLSTIVTILGDCMLCIYSSKTSNFQRQQSLTVMLLFSSKICFVPVVAHAFADYTFMLIIMLKIVFTHNHTHIYLAHSITDNWVST